MVLSEIESRGLKILDLENIFDTEDKIFLIPDTLAFQVPNLHLNLVNQYYGYNNLYKLILNFQEVELI